MPGHCNYPLPLGTPTPVVPFCLFQFGVSLFRLKNSKKGILVIMRLLGNLHQTGSDVEGSKSMWPRNAGKFQGKSPASFFDDRKETRIAEKKGWGFLERTLPSLGKGTLLMPCMSSALTGYYSAQEQVQSPSLSKSLRSPKP